MVGLEALADALDDGGEERGLVGGHAVAVLRVVVARRALVGRTLLRLRAPLKRLLQQSRERLADSRLLRRAEHRTRVLGAELDEGREHLRQRADGLRQAQHSERVGVGRAGVEPVSGAARNASDKSPAAAAAAAAHLRVAVLDHLVRHFGQRELQQLLHELGRRARAARLVRESRAADELGQRLRGGDPDVLRVLEGDELAHDVSHLAHVREEAGAQLLRVRAEHVARRRLQAGAQRRRGGEAERRAAGRARRGGHALVSLARGAVGLGT